MIIKTLIENTAISDKVESEHGLSLYIQTNKHKILFDLGQSDLAFKNAKTLDVDITKIDTVIISHGHYDHGGGLNKFLKLNSLAKIYIHRKAFENHYSIKKNQIIKQIGLDKSLITNERLIFIDDYLKIDEELELFANVRQTFLPPVFNQNLLMDYNNKKVKDTFEHEQNLIITTNKSTVLFAGCAHNGIINIINKANEIKNNNINYVIGGFHLYNHNENKTEPKDRIEKLSLKLKEINCNYYTCHCTGVEAYKDIKTFIGDKIQYLATGSMIEI